jgi:hypothetical protein
MGEYLLVFGIAGIIWLAFSLSAILKAFQAFHRDYKRVHGLKDEHDSN